MRTLLSVSLLSLSAASLAACSQEVASDEAPVALSTRAAVPTEAATATANILDPNTATEAQLAAAPGMTTDIATAIVAGRPYAGASAFNAKLLETLPAEAAAKAREAVFVPVNLNTATREDIALIPGMTEKMIGEFLEYRPYADMAEFDREIGKYVDAAEVARFRRYVSL